MDTALTILAGASFSVSLFAVVKLLMQQSKITSSNKPTDEAVLKAAAKADELVHRASQSARKIIVKAELEGIREIAKDKIEAGKLEAAFERELATLMATVLNKIEAIGLKTNTKQQAMLEKMEKSMLAYLARSQRLLDMRFTTFFDQAASSLLSTSTNAKVKLEQHVDKEIATAQAEIEAYKNARLKLLDEQFISLVEDAMRVVLEKKLTASDHMDLIYHSLDQAKKEHVLG